MTRPRGPGTFALAAALLLASISGWAENIRGPVGREVALEPKPSFEQAAELRYLEFVSVRLPGSPQENRFLEGVQIELTLSEEARRVYDNFGFIVYDRIEPPPQLGARAFTGRRAFLHYLLPLNRLIYVISFSETAQRENDLTRGVFRLREPRDMADLPVLVGIVPIAKGIPASLESLVFYLRIRPLVQNRGALELSLERPAVHERADYAVYVDGEEVAPEPAAGEGQNASISLLKKDLDAGVHSLRVRSELYQEVDTTFSIDPGSTTRLEVTLRELFAVLSLRAPRGAAVYLDGEKLEEPIASELHLSAGEHVVRLKFGEYSGSRTFTAEPGKRYTVQLTMDILVKED